MHEIEMKLEEGPMHHKCIASKEGDWDVFRCPICKDYERRINRRTGEMRVSNQSATIRHSGFSLPNPNPQINLWNNFGTISGNPIWKLN